MLEYFDKVTASVQTGKNGAYNNGEWTPSYNTAVNIQIIAPQPLKANELQMLPEGERVLNHVKTWVDEKIMTREVLKDSAKITYDSKTYLVVQVDDWNVDGNFYRIVMKEITYDES